MRGWTRKKGMRQVAETLLLPHRLGFALLGALPRAVSALERIEAHLGDIEGRLARIDDVPGEIEGLQRAFERSSDEIAALREALRPMVSDIDQVKEAVEPLQPAAERLGRLAQRLPGGQRP